MKFILGYHPTIKSPLDPSRPLLWFQIRSRFNDVDYNLERLRRNESGVVLPELMIYDSDDFPAPVIEQWLKDGHIVEWHDKSKLIQPGDELRAG